MRARCDLAGHACRLEVRPQALVLRSREGVQAARPPPRHPGMGFVQVSHRAVHRALRVPALIVSDTTSLMLIDSMDCVGWHSEDDMWPLAAVFQGKRPFLRDKRSMVIPCRPHSRDACSFT